MLPAKNLGIKEADDGMLHPRRSAVRACRADPCGRSRYAMFKNLTLTTTDGALPPLTWLMIKVVGTTDPTVVVPDARFADEIRPGLA